MKIKNILLYFLLMPTSTVVLSMDKANQAHNADIPNPNVVREIVKEEEMSDLLQLFLKDLTKDEKHLYQLGPIFERDQPIAEKRDILKHLLAQRERELRREVEERVRARIGDKIDEAFREYGLIGVDGSIEDKIKTIRSELFHNKCLSDILRDDRNKLLEEKMGSSQ